MSRVIEYYYALASPWSYLGNALLKEIATRHDVNIDPIIIDYDHMFDAAGTIPLPRRPTLRKAYRLVELERWSERRGVALNAQPAHYQGEIEEPNELLAALVVTAAKAAGANSLRLGHAISRALWAEERNPFTASELLAIANAEDMDGQALLKEAETDAIRELYEQQTKQSIARGVFGMPFYIYRDEPFWGQDRLELLEAAIARGD